MAKTINFGYTDTPISGVTSLTFPRGLVNFGADFKVRTEKKDEMILTNLSSPIDRPEKFRIQWQIVDSIYNGSGISEANQAPSVRGVSVLMQLTEVASITDSVDPSYRVDVPVSIHCVVRIPAVEELTEAHVQTALGRLVSGFYETGSTTTNRIKALLRGSLEPSDI